MKVLSNTLAPAITGHSDSSGGCYYIESIAGHLDVEITADDIIEAYNSGRDNDTAFNTYLLNKAWRQLGREITLWVCAEDAALEFAPAPTPNTLRLLITGDLQSTTFPLGVAMDLGYNPSRFESRAEFYGGQVEFEEVAA